MAECIERKVAFDAITDLAGKSPTRSAYEAVWKSARVLKNIPAADVAPVVHGRWLDGRCTAYGWEEPDSCGYDGYETEPWRHTPLCPNCGARMDGEE